MMVPDRVLWRAVCGVCGHTSGGQPVQYSTLAREWLCTPCWWHSTRGEPECARGRVCACPECRVVARIKAAFDAAEEQ
jgi:hypothetical protein